MGKYVALSNFKNGKDKNGNGVQVVKGQLVELDQDRAQDLLKAGLVSSSEDVLKQKLESLNLKKEVLEKELSSIHLEILALASNSSEDPSESVQQEIVYEEEPKKKKKK